MFPPGPVLSNASWTRRFEGCQAGARGAGQPWSGILWVLTVLALVLAPRRAAASSTVEVRCPELPSEQAAAFDARAHTELLVRGLSGTVRLECAERLHVYWTPRRGAPRRAALDTLDVEAALDALVALLEVEPAPVPRPTEPEQEQPSPSPSPARVPPGLDLRAGALGRLWGGQGAFGAEILLGVPVGPLTLTASGNVTRGLVSYQDVSLYVLQARAGAEVLPFDVLRLAVGAGPGRPFTTETSSVTPLDSSASPWLVEGFLRAAFVVRASLRVRIEFGGEVSVFSRPVRLWVDETRGYDFGWQPGVFLQAAFEVR